MSLALGLTNETDLWRVLFNETDCPEGAYLGTIPDTETTVSGTVQLNRTLQPGRYFVSWKVMDYGAGNGLDFSIGDSSTATADLNYGDFNGQWTEPVVIDVPSASTTAQITFHRNRPFGNRQIFLLRGLYITPSPDEAVYADDSIVNLHYPIELDSSPAEKGNVLENSSFEVGTGHGWGMAERSSRDFSIASLWDTTVAFDGAASLKLPNFSELVSRPYRLRCNRQYTLSAWVRAESVGTATLTASNSNVSLPPDAPPTVSFSQTFAVDTTWRRVSLSGVLLDYPTSDYYVRIKPTAPEGEDIWVDAVQLEEGGLTAYAPIQPLETGLVCETPNNLFYEDEPATVQLWVRNSGDSLRSVTIPYEIYDYLNRRVASASTNIEVPAGGRWSGSLDVSVGQNGIFRMALWVKGLDRTRDEMVYGMVPRPHQVGMDPDSFVGIHANFTDFQFAALQKLGVKWNRVSSPSLAFRWSVREPSEGNFQWSSDDMTKATSHGISVLGTIGVRWPAWAEDTNHPGRPDLSKWRAFVEAVVARYKTQVKFWEIWNEPQYEFQPSFYGELLKEAVAAIHGVDPQAKVVGLGGVAHADWSIDTLDYLGNSWLTNNLAAVSTHIYPLNTPHWYTDWHAILEKYKLPVWNTEAGIWNSGFYTGENSDFIQAADYTWPIAASERFEFGHRGSPELLAYSVLSTLGNGLTKYFYYDGRIYVGPAYQENHPTIFEYDDSIRSVGIAYAVLAKLFDHSIGLGNVSPDADSYMYLFNRGGTPVLGIWSSDRDNRSLTLGLSSSLYRVYDLMGNRVPITGGAIPYGATPVYVEGTGVSVAALQTAVQSGVVMTRDDITPPNVSLVVFPTGPTEADPVKFRWLASDDTSSPRFADPNAIEYSYRLSGHDMSWSAWSAEIFADYFDLASGTYQFQVRARDAAGNEASTPPVTVQVGDGNSSSPPAISTSLSNGRLRLTWSLDYLRWILQKQTNLSGDGLDGDWTDVAGSDSTNQVTVPIDLTGGGILFRLVSP